jgi:hypothetical protein
MLVRLVADKNSGAPSLQACAELLSLEHKLVVDLAHQPYDSQCMKAAQHMSSWFQNVCYVCVRPN